MDQELVHATAVVDPGAQVGPTTRIWHFAHVTADARIGDRCVIGQGCYVGAVTVGDGCRIQNNVSLFDGVVLAEDVFVGPSCVFTNVKHARAHVSRKQEFEPTRVGRGATIGANATIVCGTTIGDYAMVGAGAVVVKDVPPHAIVVGVPAGWSGWACKCGETLPAPVAAQIMACARCGETYRSVAGGVEVVDASARAAGT